jgi:hypothetical protein
MRIVALTLAVAFFWLGLVDAQQSSPRPVPKPTTRAPRPATTAARGVDPFVGVWRLSPAKSKYEQGGAPKSFTRTYEDRGGGTIFLTIDAINADGSTVLAYMVYKRDGKPYPEASAGAKAIRMVTVAAVDTRTEDVSALVDGKPAPIGNRIAVSADGKTMTQTIRGEVQGKPFTNTVVYEKQ